MWTVWFPGEKDVHRDEHRTEVTGVTEGGMEGWTRKAFGGQFGFWAGRKRFWGGRRTEVTEGVCPEFPEVRKR